MVAILVNSLAGGGAERVALTLLEELKKKGLEILLICIEKEQSYEVPEGTQVLYLTDFQKLHNPVIKMFWVFLSAFRLSKLIKKYNIEYVQSHLIRSNFINTAAKYFGAKHKAQLVTHLALDFSEGNFLMRKIRKRLYSWLYRKADEVVSISEVMRRDLEKSMKLAENNVPHLVIHNPHDLRKIQEMARSEIADFDFDPNKKYLISAGRLLKHKRVEVAIQALSVARDMHPDLELIILGEGKDKDSFRQVSEKLKMQPHVHFLGHSPNPFAYIARSDIFLLSSEREGLPNIIIESLACSTPVISSDCATGPREILSPDSDFSIQLKDEISYSKYGVLYPVGRADLLAESIDRLLSDTPLRQRYQAAGPCYVQNFAKEVIAGQYVDRFYPELNSAPLTPQKEMINE